MSVGSRLGARKRRVHKFDVDGFLFFLASRLHSSTPPSPTTMSWGGRGAMGMGNELRWMDPKLAKEMGYKVNPSDEAMHSQMEPYVRWAMENWPWIIHWFTFIKANNEFYFAGETKDLCIKAAAKITQKYFFLSNEEFYELKNKVNSFNELGKEVLENEYLENAGRIFEDNQKLGD